MGRQETENDNDQIDLPQNNEDQTDRQTPETENINDQMDPQLNNRDQRDRQILETENPNDKMDPQMNNEDQTDRQSLDTVVNWRRRRRRVRFASLTIMVTSIVMD